MRPTLRQLGRALAVALAMLIVAAPAPAMEKIGTTSMQVLKIAQGVRGIGMGNALTASATDAEAIWYNPGALTELHGQQLLLAQINMPADVHLNSVALARQWGDYTAVSLHAINLFTNDMKVRTWERPQGTGEYFNAWDLALGVGAARKLTDRFSLGANIRYLHSRLEDETYDGVAVDLGTLYKTGLRSMRLGMAIQNLGPNVKYSGSFLDYRNRVQNGGELISHNYEGASLPTMFRLGVAFDIYELFGIKKHPDYNAQLAVEMNHPSDNRERLNIGAEGAYRNQLFLRLGGKIAYDEESVAAGFGLLIPVFDGYRVKFDYAYSYWGKLTKAVSEMDGADQLKGQPHRLSIGLEW
jgi:hypothetical protein